MDRRIELLRDWGCDIKGAMDRMLNDEEFYIECITSVNDDESFEGLKIAVADKDAHKAFEYAHTLKGILANVGITPMYKLSAEIVEPLRNGSFENVDEKIKTLLEMKKTLDKIVKE